MAEDEAGERRLGSRGGGQVTSLGWSLKAHVTLRGLGGLGAFELLTRSSLPRCLSVLIISYPRPMPSQLVELAGLHVVRSSVRGWPALEDTLRKR